VLLRTNDQKNNNQPQPELRFNDIAYIVYGDGEVEGACDRAFGYKVKAKTPVQNADKEIELHLTQGVLL